MVDVILFRFPRSNTSPLWLFVLLAGFTPYRAHAQTAVDPNQWYRLSNSFLGENRVLEVSSAKDNHSIMSKKRQSPGQFWRLQETGEGGWYRLYNRRMGDRSALGADPDGNGVVMIALSADTSAPGPRWQLVPVDDGLYRLTTETLGDGFSLDTYSDGTNAPFMGETGDFSGQMWKLQPAEDADALAAEREAGAPQAVVPLADGEGQGGRSPIGIANPADSAGPTGTHGGGAAEETTGGPPTGPHDEPILEYSGPQKGFEGSITKITYEYYVSAVPREEVPPSAYGSNSDDPDVYIASPDHVLSGLLRQYGIRDGSEAVWTESRWKDGLKDGKDTKNIPGAPTEVCYYREGVLNGPFVSYWQNGQKRSEGAYLAGKWDGKITLWDNEGQVIFEHPFADGECADCAKPVSVNSHLTGEGSGSEELVIYEYYLGPEPPDESLSYLYAASSDHVLNGYLRQYQWVDSGKLAAESNQKDGWQDGKTVSYHPNGQLAEVGYFKSGQEEGPSVAYWENGQKSHEGNYVAGLQEGKWTWWDEAGKVNYEQTFEKGICVHCTDDQKQYDREHAKARPTPLTASQQTHSEYLYELEMRKDKHDAYDGSKWMAGDSASTVLDSAAALAELGVVRLPERNSTDLDSNPAISPDAIGWLSQWVGGPVFGREIAEEGRPRSQWPTRVMWWYGGNGLFLHQFRLTNFGSPRINPVGNGVLREYAFNVSFFARQHLSLSIRDFTQPKGAADRSLRNSEMHTEMVFFPRLVVPSLRYSADRTTVIVTLPTREEVTFDAGTMEITGGVLRETTPIDTSSDRLTRSFTEISYSGDGMVLRSDNRGVSARDPEDGENEDETALLAWGTKECRIEKTLLWERSQDGWDHFRFATDAEFFRLVKQQCKWDVSAKDFGLETLDEVAPKH